MASLAFGEFHLHDEVPEAERCRVSILVLPGLFQALLGLATHRVDGSAVP